MSGGQIGSHIVFRGPNGFARGVGAQHTQDFCAWYGSVPGLHVCAPYSARDHRGALKKALRDQNPVVILENEELYEKEFSFDDSFQNIDYVQEYKCVIEKTGKDVTIIGISLNVEKCLEAGKILMKEEIADAEIINLFSIRPLDINTIISSVKKTGKLIIVDNAWPDFSVASEISSLIYDKFYGTLKCKIIKICGKNCPTAYSEGLEKITFPSVEEIIQEVKKLMI
jgi:pyruvate dehydrogenase E1 component beta subunit